MKTHSQRLPAWVQVAGVIILIAAFSFSYYVYASTKDSGILLIVVPSLLVLVLFIGPVLILNQSISLSQDAITMRYFPIFRKTIPLSEVEEAKIMDDFSPLRDAGGIGLRKAPGKLVLANASGVAIEIISKESSYIYSFGKSAKTAHHFLNEINKRTAS